ncbi:peptidoglycan-binding domain-containing protein [Nocardioides panzhihuensis]|uniref:Lysozyme family protein n=1 Tax=Nocardioides panzhihuensis TaxID=860243 RepID=A0A7Z0DMZ5_9ACTN|nr:peptidoglycan-binding domain-containing protein [Nocardioides panzhihuensis]NYI78473.1 lysozyme family protein [Nocardioides panzhihuensis]
MTSTITRRLVGSVVAVGLAATGIVATASIATAEVGAGNIAASSISAQATQNFGLTTAEAKVVQVKLLKKFGFTGKAYPGKIDGKLGTNSWKAFQVYLKKRYGYTGKIDGDPGKNTIKALQRLLNHRVLSRLTVDGEAGPKTKAAFKKYAKSLAR